MTGLSVVSGGLLGVALRSTPPNHVTVLDVQVTDLQWRAEIDIEEQKTVTRQSWRDSMPMNAAIVKSETRQRGTKHEQRGSKTITVTERYQVGTRTETYDEPERYQAGTRTETYDEPERYQSGTDETCKTTSRGNGVGQRTCKTVPVYSTRRVERTRSVPVYRTRQVARTRSVPVYRTRQIRRTRQVPVYRTRQVARTRQVPIYRTRQMPRTRSLPVYRTRTVPVQQPIMVSVPVQDTWVTDRLSEWVPQQTDQQHGTKDAIRKVDIKLAQMPPQRIVGTRMYCYLNGTCKIQQGWFTPPKSQAGSRQLPCEEYDAVNIGDQIKLRLEDFGSARLARSPAN